MVWNRTSTSADTGRFEPQGFESNELKIMGTSGGGSGKLTLNCESNSHGVSVLGPPHSAQATYDMTLPSALGTAGQVLKINVVNGAGTAATLSWGPVSVTDITKTTGDITIDAQDSTSRDIIFKSVSSGNAYTMLTLDGSADGSASFNNDVTVGGDLILEEKSNAIMFEGGEVKLKHKNNVGLTIEMGSDEDAHEPVLELKSTNNGSGSSLDFLNTGVTSGANVQISKIRAYTGSSVLKSQIDTVYNASTGTSKMRHHVHDGSSTTMLLELDGSDSSVDIKGALHLDGTAVTATATQLNYLDLNTASGASSSTYLRGDGTWSTVAAATTATNVTAADASTANTNYFVTLADGATGAQGIETSSYLRFNPNTGVLTADLISGSGITSSSSITLKGGDNNDDVYVENSPLKLQQISAPSTTTDKLYNVGGTLTWNGTALGSGGASNLTGLSDVSLGTPALGEVLRWNGSNWVDATPFTYSSYVGGNSNDGVAFTAVTSYHYSVDTTAASVGATLPAASGVTAGAEIRFKLRATASSYTLDIKPNGSDTIDSSGSDHTLSTANSSVTLVRGTGTNWEIV